MADTGILSTIKAQIDKIKYQLSAGGLSDLIVRQLQVNQDRLQTWYDKLLSSSGILTEEERETLEKELDSAKKSTLEADAKKLKRKMVIVLVGSIVLITGIIIYIKVRK